jgi:CheY-like chemotaxis protein
MVVDDDHQELDRTLEAIRKHGVGYEARIARGGFEALDYLFGRGRFHERRRHPLPDLILLDFDMAPLDGLEVFRRMREADHLPRIPVAILCKSEQERERAAQAAAGACAYVVKPMTPEGFDEILSVAGVGGHFLALPPVNRTLSQGRERSSEGSPQPEQGEEGLDEGEEEGAERVATLRTEAILLQRALGRDLDRVAKRRRDEQARWSSLRAD